MPQVMYKEGQKVPVKIWNDFVPMESGVYDQSQKLATMPFIYKHLALMPDAHIGKGATVGSVIATRGAIIPAAVGVDIGCGMMAVRLSLKASELPDNLNALFHQISRDVPLGQSEHKSPNRFATPRLKALEARWDAICKRTPEMTKHLSRNMSWTRQMGSLGGGNHFIELCIDENQDVWIMLHSGSRNVGNAIGKHFIQAAQKDMERHFIQLPDKDLAYLCEGSTEFDAYVEAVQWAQEYAAANRDTMMDIVMAALQTHLPPFKITKEAINCHHNFISHENHYGENVYVTRKGAIRARKEDFGIIPGSMGAKSFIIQGCGSEESFCSCSHGAGRVMSRSKAKELVSLDEHVRDTEGIVCRKDEGVIDETPRAYKNIDDVMKSQSDLVRIHHTLKQILCVKG